MMTEYEYIVMKGAAIAPHVENNVKISRLILEFILDCGIPNDEFCTWKKHPQLKRSWNLSFEIFEHRFIHGFEHACVLYDPPKKRYVYEQ